jgi:IclR family transcriptional regulator, acetate operon repressor
MPELARSGGVQSVGRVLDLLELVAEAGGEIGLSELADRSGLPLASIHRLLRTMVDRGYMRQLPNRRYALGARLIPLGQVAGTMLGSWARPVLTTLVDALGESANLAVLDDDAVMYIGQVASRHSMRMFTEVGRRVHAHCTGVGKALLSQLPSEAVRELLIRTGMPATTPRTITDPDEFIAELAQVRREGHAVDEGEQEVGVRCVAVPVPGALTPLGISVSGPAPRMTEELVARAVPLLHHAADRLTSEISCSLRPRLPRDPKPAPSRQVTL